MHAKSSYVDILASQRNGTLYIGVTDDLSRRVYEHKQGMIEGFTKTYNVKRLVWYEVYEEITFAIQREKQMKKWNRDWKLKVIEEINPEWNDLYETLI